MTHETHSGYEWNIVYVMYIVHAMTHPGTLCCIFISNCFDSCIQIVLTFKGVYIIIRKYMNFDSAFSTRWLYETCQPATDNADCIFTCAAAAAAAAQSLPNICLKVLDAAITITKIQLNVVQ